jgi:hypothetical protein
MSRRACPNPAKRLVPISASSQGYAASSDGMSVCEPSAWSWLSTPPIDGSSTSNVASPSETMSACDPAPRVTGGQRNATIAIATGKSIVIPTATSSGPPGR